MVCNSKQSEIEMFGIFQLCLYTMAMMNDFIGSTKLVGNEVSKKPSPCTTCYRLTFSATIHAGRNNLFGALTDD